MGGKRAFLEGRNDRMQMGAMQDSILDAADETFKASQCTCMKLKANKHSIGAFCCIKSLQICNFCFHWSIISICSCMENRHLVLLGFFKKLHLATSIPKRAVTLQSDESSVVKLKLCKLALHCRSSGCWRRERA